MKKTFCLILVVLFVFPAFCLADSNVSVSLFLNGQDSGNSVWLYEGAGEILAVSSLWPDHVVVFTEPSEAGLIRPETLVQFSPEAFSQTREVIRGKVLDWIGTMNTVTRKGSFTGDVFEHAATEDRIVFTPAELILFTQTLRDDSKAGANQFLAYVTESLCTLAASLRTEKDLQFCLKIYDEGLYATLEVLRQGNVILTASADFSSADVTRLVFSRAEESRYYFTAVDITEKEGRTELASSVYSSGEPSFRRASADVPLYTENLALEQGSQGGYLFELTISTMRTEKPVRITGTMAGGGDTPLRIEASASFSDADDKKLSLTLEAQKTEEPVNREQFTGKSEITPDQIAGNGAFLTTVTGKFAVLAADIYRILPSEYQQVLYSLLFK